MKAMKKFKVNTVHGVEVISGYPIRLAVAKKEKFFSHATLYCNDGTISISEVKTGRMVAKGSTLKEAKEAAEKKINEMGVRKMYANIKKLSMSNGDPFEKAIEESGITLIETEKSDLKAALKKYKLIK